MPLPIREATWRLTERLREARRIGEAVEEGLPKKEIAREMGLGRSTLYRRLGEARGERYGHKNKRLEAEETE